MDRLDLRKVFYHSEKLLELKKTGDTWPVHMQVGLVSACNHRCVFCHGGHSAAELKLKNSVMDLDILLNCLKQAKNHGLKAVTFVGNGEPLLYPHIDKLFDSLKTLGIEIGIFSNGALLNKSRQRFVAEYATFIRFSVNGGNTAEHDKVHQCKGDFPIIIDNIKSLLKIRESKNQSLPTVGTQMVFYEENYRSIYQAAQLWKSIGVDYFEIKPLVANEFELEYEVKPTINTKEVLRLMEKAKSLQDEKFEVYAKYKMYSNQLVEKLQRNYDKCLGASISLNLLENGDVTICPHYELNEDYIFGNINRDSFENIWLSERRKKILSKLNVHECPQGCKQHPLNEILWDYLHPKKENHINFV